MNCFTFPRMSGRIGGQEGRVFAPSVEDRVF